MLAMSVALLGIALVFKSEAAKLKAKDFVGATLIQDFKQALNTLALPALPDKTAPYLEKIAAFNNFYIAVQQFYIDWAVPFGPAIYDIQHSSYEAALAFNNLLHEIDPVSSKNAFNYKANQIRDMFAATLNLVSQAKTDLGLAP